MDRRKFLSTSVGLSTLVGVSGCLSDPTKATFTYQPANPDPGQSIVFDATGSEGDSYRWIFKDGEGHRERRRGKKVTLRTAPNEPGVVIATLQVQNDSGFCLSLDCGRVSTSKRVYVGPSSTDSTQQGGIHIDTEKVDLSLRGNKTKISTDESGIVQFSATNLIGNEDLTIQLILETDAGLSVSSSRFVDSGGGQYTSTFVLGPGESEGIRINIEADTPGQHTLTGRAAYYFGDNTNDIQTESATIDIVSTS